MDRESNLDTHKPTAEWKRRALLAKAGQGLIAANATGLLFAQAARAQSEPAMPPEKRLGWAVVGLGKFATNQILPSFAECKRSKLVALVSGSADKARKIGAQYGVDPRNLYNYQNFESIRDNPAVDVVYIILPNSLHAEYTIRAARAGKHVLCEKPMANSVADCQAMIAECNRANRKLMVAYRAQYENFNRAAIDLARSELGRLKVIVADHGRIVDPTDPADRWRLERKMAGGGSLVDIGIYSLNATRYLTGEEPVEVSAMLYSTPNDPRFREVEETVNFVLRFPSGVLANCTSSYGYAEVKRYRVFGDKAWLDLDPATDYYEHRLQLGREKSIEERQIKKDNQFAQEIDHLSGCVIENKTPRTPGEEGLQDVRIIQAIYEAARIGRTIKV